MRLVTFEHQSRTYCGIRFREYIINLQRAWELTFSHAAPFPLATVDDILLREHPTWRLIRMIYDFIERAFDDNNQELHNNDILIPENTVRFLPPLTRPGKIIGIGMNYPESESSKPSEHPVIFLKASSTLTGNRSPILLPRESHSVYCEGEIAVIIGKKGKYINAEDAFNFIFGFSIANDLTERTYQNRTSQWQSGKLPDTFTPMGPHIVSLDEIDYKRSFNIQVAINNEVYLNGNSEEMFFDIPYLVSYISSLCTLYPGDILLTGSPKMCNGHPAHEHPLQTGDTVSIVIDGLGQLTNHVVKEE